MRMLAIPDIEVCARCGHIKEGHNDSNPRYSCFFCLCHKYADQLGDE